jgi:hypothetical protein
MGGPGGLGEIMYAAYVHELGPRLRSLAPVLANGIMTDTAGTVPEWGYRILAAGPELSLNILMPFLSNDDLILRERATVALGYMGEPAAPARGKLEAAMAKTANAREKLLLAWAIRQIDGDTD